MSVRLGDEGIAAAPLVHAWLTRIALGVIEASSALTQLDARIGDGDHGINLERGFRVVAARLPSPDAPGTAAELLRGAGRALVSTVGGAAGPLYGTFFLVLADGLATTDRLTTVELAGAWDAAAAAVGRRGRSTTGEKTMLDVLVPVGRALWKAGGQGDHPIEAVRRAAVIAAEARDATAPMIATKGRASYLGERSRGHIDPGAASSALVTACLAEAMGQFAAGPGARR